jgi:hypothetical protein
MGVSGYLHDPAALPPGKILRLPLDMSLGETQNRSGRGGEGNKIPAPAENRTPFVQPVA